MLLYRGERILLSCRCSGRCSWSKSCWRRREGTWSSHWLGTHGGSLSGSGINTVNAPCGKGVVPSSLILTSVHVKAYTQFLTYLDVHVRDMVGAKNPEATLTWILVVCLNYIFLTLPRISCTWRYASLLRENGYHFTFYFHINLFIYSFDCLSFFEKLASVFAKRRTFLLTECEINKIVLNLKTF